MINYKELEDIGHKTGFTHIVPLDCKTIELLPEVRQMCQADTCHMYEKNWSCPPGCGSLEECQSNYRALHPRNYCSDSRGLRRRA